MDKEKFHIPFPNEQTIRNEIEQIVTAGVRVKERDSFFLFMKSMYRQIGLRHLFSDRSELMFSLITAITILIFFMLKPDSVSTQVDDLYSFIFIFSPLLFVTLSIYTYSNKWTNETYEVEMACKYNVYQIIAFRMLVYSFIAIVVNSIMIAGFITIYDSLHFFRAFMISVTGLFVFAVIFLYALMKHRSSFTAFVTIGGWIGLNIALNASNNRLYSDLLVQIPLFVYAIVLLVAFIFYIHLIKRLFYVKQTKGALLR